MSGEFDGFDGLMGVDEFRSAQWVPPADETVWAPEPWAKLLGAEAMRDYEAWMAGERRAAEEQRARETRLYWSGRPDEVTRQILRAYGVTAGQIGLVQRSAFSPEYRRRQRARVKRRRR